MPFSFLSCCPLPQECLYLYLKRGESLTYGTRESLTYGIGESLIPFEVIKERKNMLVVRKAKKKIVRPDGVHEAWVYQSPATPLITFQEVVKECAESCGEHPSKTTGVVIALMDRIAHYLKIGRAVRIEGIGTIKPVISSEAADSSEELTDPNEVIKGVKLRFYPHQPLQKAIAENGYEYHPELDD